MTFARHSDTHGLWVRVLESGCVHLCGTPALWGLVCPSARSCTFSQVPFLQLEPQAALKVPSLSLATETLSALGARARGCPQGPGAGRGRPRVYYETRWQDSDEGDASATFKGAPKTPVTKINSILMKY